MAFHAQVNGDSGNDSDLFRVKGVKGCVVGNAMPELLDSVNAILQSDSLSRDQLPIGEHPTLDEVPRTLQRIYKVWVPLGIPLNTCTCPALK